METLFEQGPHRWAVIARDPERASALIDTNEYLVSHGRESLLTDPGGMEIFPAVFAALANGADASTLRWIFSSHQDPDVVSSLALWLEFNPSSNAMPRRSGTPSCRITAATPTPSSACPTRARPCSSAA
jgi:flavorubredoxin